jgi:hypothetical protein
MYRRLKYLHLIENFIEISWPEFIETSEGMVFIKNEYDVNYSKNTNYKCTDYTANESFINHIHVEDKIGIKLNKSFKEVIKTIGNMWAVKLKREFPNYKFRIYLSCSDDYVLRFHKIHDNEPFWLNEIEWKDEIEKGNLYVWEI